MQNVSCPPRKKAQHYVHVVRDPGYFHWDLLDAGGCRSSDASFDICPDRDYAMRQDGYVIPLKEFIRVRYYTSKETFNYPLCLANLEIAGHKDLITQ